MTEAERISGWNLGAMNAIQLASGAIQGTSLFDGSVTVFDFDADAAAGIVDYRVGGEDGPRNLRVSALVEAEANGCILSLIAVRPPGMDDDRWARLCVTHDVEVLLIKSQAETEANAASS